MKLLRFLLQSFMEVLKGLVLKTVPSLVDTILGFLKALKGLLARCKLEHADKNATNEKCGTVHHPSFHRPDPLIYSQKYLLQLGLAVTWDNPDIAVLLNGVIVPEGTLLPNTDYEIDATIWNNSYDAPVVGLAVDFALLSFGTGTTLHPIGSRVINLGVKGGVNHPAHARIPWRTPAAGHYCIQVDLKWADDVNPANNMGQNNVNVVSPQSPARFTFQLKNNTGKPESYRFTADTYTLPALKDCEKKEKPKGNAEKWKEIQARHNRNAYPVPPGWTVSTTPDAVSLAAEQEVEIEVDINPPAAFTGTKAFNVHAVLSNGKYAGGVTVYVTKP